MTKQYMTWDEFRRTMDQEIDTAEKVIGAIGRNDALNMTYSMFGVDYLSKLLEGEREAFIEVFKGRVQNMVNALGAQKTEDNLNPFPRRALRAV